MKNVLKKRENIEDWIRKWARIYTQRHTDSLEFHALDLGCGDGRVTEILAEEGFIVDAVDKDPNCFVSFKKKLDERDALIRNKITFHCIDAEKFDYKKGRYGIVFCTNLFHLLSKEKMRRILKKILYSLRYRDGVLVAQYRDKNEITVRDFNDFFVITSNVKIHGDDGKLYRRFVATHANPFQRIQNSIRSVFIKEFPKRKRLHGKF